jgi:1-aminocyclopropane-1-carboxylate deaminase/D-cysteine desulfhydrase-like pyridoxal-dependent ACC family enzyme
VTADPLWPIFDHFPRLAELPRVALRSAPTPVSRIGDRLWIKRDDLTAEPIGGNKVRALELLLGQFRRGTHLRTAGSRGSTHVLTTAIHAKRLGMSVEAASWPQEMNDVARRVDGRLNAEGPRRHFSNPVSATLWLTWHALKRHPVIPAGGTSPLGMIGHVNAALELAGQIRAGILPQPSRVVVPLGTGGTAAGLALGFAFAGIRTEVVAARVVPRIVGRHGRVVGQARAACGMIERIAGERNRWRGIDVRIVDAVYGGAYGRPLAGAPATTPDGVALDATYSAKAFVAAVESARDADTLFWLTFDSRWMNE